MSAELEAARDYRTRVEYVMRRLNDYVLAGGDIFEPDSRETDGCWELARHDGYWAEADRLKTLCPAIKAFKEAP